MGKEERIGIWVSEEHIDIAMEQEEEYGSGITVKTISNREKSLTNWLKRNRAKGKRVNIALEQQQFEMTLMKLPSVAQDEVEKIIEFQLNGQKKNDERKWFAYESLYTDSLGNQIYSVLSGDGKKLNSILERFEKKGLVIQSLTTIAQGLLNYISKWKQIQEPTCFFYLEGERSLMIFLLEGKIAYVYPWVIGYRDTDQIVRIYREQSGFLQRQYEFPQVSHIYILPGETQYNMGDEALRQIEVYTGSPITMMEPSQFNQQEIKQWSVMGLVEQETRLNLLHSRKRREEKRKGIAIGLFGIVLLGCLFFGGVLGNRPEEYIPVVQEEDMGEERENIQIEKRKNHELLIGIRQCWTDFGVMEELRIEGGMIIMKGNIESYGRLGQLGERLNQLEDIKEVMIKESYRDEGERISFTIEGRL